MAGVMPDSLEFCFTAITQGTPAEGAVLEIETRPAGSALRGVRQGVRSSSRPSSSARSARAPADGRERPRDAGT